MRAIRCCSQRIAIAISLGLGRGPEGPLYQQLLLVVSTITMAVTVRSFGEVVACPFFMPDQRLDVEWPFPRRLPLGAGWSGTCTAVSHPGVRPTPEELKTGCNLGYARRCARLPAERHADAVRFALGEERDGVLKVRYACEREYLPVSHGELVYEVVAASWQTTHFNGCLQRMAECYVEVQMQRRNGAETPVTETKTDPS